MANKTFRYATILAAAAAIISGTNNFLTKIAVTAVKDPIVFTTLKNAAVAVFLVGILLVWRKLPEILKLNRGQIFKLLAIGAIGGSIPFALYFTGLAATSAINASLIHKTLFLWVFLFAVPILKERMTTLQWLGIAAIFGANLFIGGFAGFKYNVGELMILAATVLWAVENIIAKKVLADISSTVLAASRMTIGSLILFFMVVSRGGGFAAVANLNGIQWGWTLLTSALLAGYVLTWYTALKYAPATYVATLLVPASIITNILSAVFVTRTLPPLQLINIILLVLGAALVIAFAKKEVIRPEEKLNLGALP